MQSVSTSTTTLNININVKLFVRNKFSCNGVFSNNRDLISWSHTSHFIDDEEFLVLPDFSNGKILAFRTKIIQLST